MRKVAIVLAALLALIVLYLLLWPIDFDPVAWTPPEAPALEGVYAPNTLLAEVERLPAGGIGPEDIAFDAEGRIYTGLLDGSIVRFQPDGSQPEVIANTEGRPLGLAFDAAGTLIVADGERGLLAVSPDGAVTVLSTEEGGVPFRIVDELVIASDGVIYFTDASSKFPLSRYSADVMEQRPHGRLLAYDPSTGETRLVLDGLYFANGVVLSPDESYVLVGELGRMRVRRVWLSGPRQGESDFFVENLPGFPDNISLSEDGTVWIALVSPRQPSLEATLPYPFVRRIIMRLPPPLLPAPQPYGFVLGFDLDGGVIHNLQGPADGYVQITSAVERDGMLYLGSLAEDAVGRLPVPPR